MVASIREPAEGKWNVLVKITWNSVVNKTNIIQEVIFMGLAPREYFTVSKFIAAQAKVKASANPKPVQNPFIIP